MFCLNSAPLPKVLMIILMKYIGNDHRKSITSSIDQMVKYLTITWIFSS